MLIYFQTGTKASQQTQDSLTLASEDSKGQYLASDMWMGGCVLSFDERQHCLQKKNFHYSLKQWQMSHSQNEQSLTWGAKINMKVNRSWTLLKAGTKHTSFLHSLKSLLLPFLAKQDLTAVRDTFAVQPWMGKLTSTCHLHAWIATPPDRVGLFWWWLC